MIDLGGKVTCAERQERIAYNAKVDNDAELIRLRRELHRLRESLYDAEGEEEKAIQAEIDKSKRKLFARIKLLSQE